MVYNPFSNKLLSVASEPLARSKDLSSYYVKLIQINFNRPRQVSFI